MDGLIMLVTPRPYPVAQICISIYTGEYFDLALNVGPYQNKIIGIGAITSARKPRRAEAHCVPSFSYLSLAPSIPQIRIRTFGKRIEGIQLRMLIA
jgi:hypothetical protein